MLQIPNLIKHPLIIVPQIILSIVMGPIIVCIINSKCSPASSGMRTAGFVGLFGTIDGARETIATWTCNCYHKVVRINFDFSLGQRINAMERMDSAR
jgi:uncharacterized membrane protein